MPTRFALLSALAAVALACGDPTGSPGDPTPIPWTPSLELAAESLKDPVVDEAFADLADPSVTAAIESIVARAAARAAAHDVAAAVTLVGEARQALREAYPEELDVHAAVLELVLLDVEERFQDALSAA